MIYTVGRSVKGASHIREDKPCQDFHIIEQSQNYTILTVADGHGSSSCPYSQDGSKIASQVFRDLLSTYYSNYQNNLHELMSFLNRDGKIFIPKEIEHEWKNRVVSFNEQHDRNTEDLTKESIYRQYGSTLLGVLITADFVYAFQLGDGDIVCIDENSISHIVETEQLLGVETYSISNPDSWKYANCTIFPLSKYNVPNLYMLSTDGMINSHVSQNDFYITCRDYYNLFNENKSEYISNNLEDWLNETSKEGCDDDITVTFAFIT